MISLFVASNDLAKELFSSFAFSRSCSTNLWCSNSSFLILNLLYHTIATTIIVIKPATAKDSKIKVSISMLFSVFEIMSYWEVEADGKYYKRNNIATQ